MKRLTARQEIESTNQTWRGASAQKIESRIPGARRCWRQTAGRDCQQALAAASPAGTSTLANHLVLCCVAPALDRASSPALPGATSSLFQLTEKLVQIWSSNERDLARLRDLRSKTAEARAYLASPGCNRTLGLTYLERLETLRRVHLARLRGNRRTAWTLMAQLDAECPPSSVSPGRRPA